MSFRNISNCPLPPHRSIQTFPLYSNKALVIFKRWATNLGGGNTQNGRDSIGRRLGVKLGNGASALENQIIVRQRGYNYWPGSNIKVGKDHTLHANCDGIVKFSKDYNTKRTFVNILPSVRNPLPNSRPQSFLLENVSNLIRNKQENL